MLSIPIIMLCSLFGDGFVITEFSQATVHQEKVSGPRLQFWTARWCSNCPGMKITAERLAKKHNLPLDIIDYDQWKEQAILARVKSFPTLVFVDRGLIQSRAVGSMTGTSAERLLKLVDVPAMSTEQSESSRPALAGTPAGFDREKEIRHLLTGEIHKGKFTRESLEVLSDWALIDLHNREHGVSTSNGTRRTSNRRGMFGFRRR